MKNNNNNKTKIINKNHKQTSNLKLLNFFPAPNAKHKTQNSKSQKPKAKHQHSLLLLCCYYCINDIALFFSCGFMAVSLTRLIFTIQDLKYVNNLKRKIGLSNIIMLN
jgi:hypothetical protein